MTETCRLQGLRVLVTREASQIAGLSSRLERAGALPVPCPLIAFRAPADWSQTDSAIARIRTFDALVFTSANAVRFFFSRAEQHPGALEDLSRLPCYAVGPATAEALSDRGLWVRSVPERFQAEGLCDLFRQEDLKGKRFLFPRAREGRDILPAFFRDQGADLVLLVVYETRPAVENRERLRSLLAARAFDCATFTSPSSVKAYAEFASPSPPSLPWREIPAVCIGDVTAQAAQSVGLENVFAASTSTLDGLVEGLMLWENLLRPAAAGPEGASGSHRAG